MDKEYIKTFQDINNKAIKSEKRNNFFKYLKDNLLSIIAIIVSVIALFK